MSDIYSHFVDALEKLAKARNSMAEHVSPGATAGMPNIPVSRSTHPVRRTAIKNYRKTTSRARRGNNYLGR